MANNNQYILNGTQAGESLTTSQYHGVYFDTTTPTDVMECDAGGTDILCCGVLYNAPADNELAKVYGDGAKNVYVKILSGQNITPGESLQPDVGNSGKWITAGSGIQAMAVARGTTGGAAGTDVLIRADISRHQAE